MLIQASNLPYVMRRQKASSSSKGQEKTNRDWIYRETIEALRRAEQKYRCIFENATEGIFQTTPDGHYLSANPALAQMYGYDSPEELLAVLTDVGRQLYVQPDRREEFTSAEADLEMARDIQQVFLPQKYPSFPRNLTLQESWLRFCHWQRYASECTYPSDNCSVRSSQRSSGVVYPDNLPMICACSGWN